MAYIRMCWVFELDQPGSEQNVERQEVTSDQRGVDDEFQCKGAQCPAKLFSSADSCYTLFVLKIGCGCAW